MYGDPYKNNNVYYLNKPKVRSSCPISFQTTSLKAQYQLRAGVFNFPKRSPMNNINNNNQKKNDFRQCTNRIKQIQKDVRMKDKTMLRNKRRAPQAIKSEKQSASSAQYSNDVPSKTKTEAKIDSAFSESSCKPRDKPKRDFRNNHYKPKPNRNSMSSQYYSDYSYSTYTYTNRENSSQNEYSEKNHDSNKKQKQKPSSISLSDHLSSEIVEKNVLSINSYTDEEDNSDIKIDEDNDSNIKIKSNSDTEIEHHESSDMQLSDMDSITATADIIAGNSPQQVQNKNPSVHNISEKSDSLKSSKKEETPISEPEFKEEEERVEAENDYSNETEKISEIIISGDYTPDQDQSASESDKNVGAESNQKNELDNVAVNNLENPREEEELHESSSQNNKDKNLECVPAPINNNENIKNRSVDVAIDDNNNIDRNDNKNSNIIEKSDDNNKGDVDEEESPRFKALLEANQKLVSVVLKNQEAILNIVENEYTKKALEHLHEAVTLLESVEPK